MGQEKLAECRSLVDTGALAQAWIGLIDLLTGKTVNNDALMPIIEAALTIYRSDYPKTRDEILSIIEQSGSTDTVKSCLEALTICGDFAALNSCKDLKVNVGDSTYFMGFPAFVDSFLSHAKFQGKTVDLGQIDFNGTPSKCLVLNNEFLVRRRDESDVTTPLLKSGKRIELGTQVWAAALDTKTERIVVTLSTDNKVLGISTATLTTETTIESPFPELRGIGIHPELRRGFFISEYGNMMFSFDLDSFKIRKQIKGFSFRPERVRIDPGTNTIVTGNLGLDLDFPFNRLREIYRDQCRDDDKKQTGESITIVDGEREEVIDTLPVGRRPTAVGISRKYIAAGNFFDNTVTIYDRKDVGNHFVVDLDVVQDFDLEFTLVDTYQGNPMKFSKTSRSRVVEGIAILDRRGWILVSGFDACVLTVIDIRARKILDVVPVQSCPFDVAVDEDERFAYVSCHVADQVSVVDLDQRREVCRLATGPSPTDLSLHGDTLLVPDSAGLTVINVGELSRNGFAAD